MDTFLRLWQYLAEFFLEWETLSTKGVYKIKTHILYSKASSRKLCRLGDIVERYCRPGQATDDSIIPCMRFACRVIRTAHTQTYTHS
jgi:hypothetical protein